MNRGTGRVLALAEYQQFSAERATVVVVPGGTELPLVVWNLAPGQANERHVHTRTDHVHVAVAGVLEYHLGDAAPQLVRPGQAVCIPAGVWHGVRNPTTEPASYLAVSTPGPYERRSAEPDSQGSP